MIDAKELSGRAGRARRCARSICGAMVGVACRNEAPSPTVATPKLESPYVCDEAHDYRAFEGSDVLTHINFQIPRREQTPEQVESLTPGDSLWQFDPKPEIRCSSDGLLQLRYAPPGPAGFSAARNRMTVTLAPGTRLLDPLAHARMKALADAVDEAVWVLRGSRCSETAGPCVLQRNPEPLRYPGALSRHEPDSEFKQVGQRSWFWQNMQGEHKVLRAVFCTTDGRFDVEVLVEAMDTGERGFDPLELVPEYLSGEYDKRRRLNSDAADGGTRG